MNNKSLRNYSSMRYVNLAIFTVLFAGFLTLAIYFAFLITPYLWVSGVKAPIENMPDDFSTALGVMLGAIGVAGSLISGFGFYYSLMSILKNDDEYVIKGFASYIAIGYMVSIALFLNAVWLYRLTTTEIGYGEIAFVIIIYLIALIIALIASNVPLVKLYGEDEHSNRTMKVIVGSLAAVDLGVAIPFLASYFVCLSSGSFANKDIVSTKFLVYGLIPLLAFLVFAIAFYSFCKGEKAKKETKLGMGLFTGGTIVNGAAILLTGIFAQVWDTKKVSFLDAGRGTYDHIIEFAVISYILAGIIILGSIGLVVYSLVPHKKKEKTISYK